MKHAAPEMAAYGKWLLFGACGLLLAVVIFNAVVDPFGVTGLNRVGVYVVREREYKMTRIHHTPHNAVLLSHSRLSAQDPRLLEGWKFFNLAVGGGKLEELSAMLKDTKERPELVVLGLDFWMFNERYWPRAEPYKSITFRRLFERYLLSLDYFWESWNALAHAARGDTHVVHAPGFLDAEFWRKGGESDPKKLQLVMDSVVRDYAYADWRTQELRDLKKWLEDREIPLVVFLHPESPILRAELTGPELAGHYENWRREMAGVFPDVIDLTASEYAVAENYYRYDPVHYKPEVSIAFLNEVVIPEAKRRLEKEP